MKITIGIIASVLFAGAALAQGAAFVPFTIDAQKYQQIDEAMSKVSMPREAHIIWQNMWQGLEQQAQRDEMTKRKTETPPVLPPPSPPPEKP